MNAPTPTLAQGPRPRPGILDIAPYKPGRASAPGVAKAVKLSANENILGCSPLAKAAFAAVMDDLSLYPDGRGAGLREAIAARYALEPERIILGCGTDEIFAMLAQTYLQSGDNIVQGEFGFGAYAIAARANEAEVRFAKERNHRIDVDEMLAQVDERTRLVFIANPANPTGTFLSLAEIERLHAGLPREVILVLDGAYAEFCRDPTFSDGLDLAREAVNVVVTHTFSKIHGLAALRVGWGYGPASVAYAIERIRLPFNVSIPAQAAAIAALGDEEFPVRSVEHVERWRDWLTQQLGGLGLEVTPSAANFLLVRFPTTPGRTAAEAESYLANHGLLVRGVAGYGLPEHLRITIGLEEHNRAVIDTLAAFLGRAAR
jgi:histidinol-phosphate aminotransferase